MQSKDMMVDFVFGKHYIHDGQLLMINEKGSEPYQDAAALKTINQSFNQFKSMNSSFYASKKLMPDSVMVNFKKKSISK